ncbi:hypothetical protein LCM23_12995 [Cytobacillus kochii]|uniref:hypothetical protein n=1 Tax=Cytobacillus kochii TaxID=859143 RepID=UPI001CD5764A|nr:hypothetical protein [Cytobacillus kochii]MCA1027011.1 hypothetical protein [Cytobacillus kochii]
MGFVVKIIPQDHTDIEGFYAGNIVKYSNEGVTVPTHTDDLSLAKVYKRRKNAENALNKILKECTFVTECEVEEIISDDVVKCCRHACGKPLTDKMDIEYSQELGEYFCSVRCAEDYYFDYMRSIPLENIIEETEVVYFKNGKLYQKDLYNKN